MKERNKNNYLTIFSDLFYDVRKDAEMNELIEDTCDWFGGIIVRYGELLNELTLHDEPRDNPFVDTVIVLLIRKIMEQIDAIIILVRHCSFSQAVVILRTLFETVVSLRFILKEDTEIRCAAYYLNHHYAELNYVIYFDENTNEGQMIRDNMGQQAFNEVASKVQAKHKAILQLIDSDALFKKVDLVRTQKMSQKRGKNPDRKVFVQWYEICSDIKSFKELATEIGWAKYYDTLYNSMSSEAHGKNAATETVFASDGMYAKVIRDVSDGFNTIDLTGSFSICGLIDLYKYMQDGEEERQEFRQYYMKYKEDNKILEKRFSKLVQERQAISD